MSESEKEVRALLIEMRRYVMHHGLLIGECVAWGKLKAMFGVGQSDEAADLDWLREYRAGKKGVRE